MRVRYKGKTVEVAANAWCWPPAASRPTPRWRTRYLGPGWELAKVRGTRFNTGDGIRMALDIGAMPTGNWSGCHAVGWDRNAPEFGDLAVGDNFQKHNYPFGIMLNANGERFVDEGADFRNYTYAKYGRVILSQPGQFAWQVFDSKVLHLLRDEYRIKRVTKVRADTLEELVPEARRRERRQGAGDDQGLQRRREDATCRSIPTSRTAAARSACAIPKSNWANTLDTPPFEAYAVTCGITFTFGGLKIDSRARVIDTDGQVDPRPVRGRRAGRRPVLLQLSGRHRPDERRRVRQDRRHHRRPARRPGAMSAAPAGSEAVYDVVVVGGGGSGLAAAIEARSTGRSVALIEKNAALGGSTAWSIGSISASSTPHQLAKGIQDSPAEHWRDMAGFNGDLDPRDNRDLRRVLADAMPDTFRWLLSHGIRFYGPMPEPPHKKPRMHNVLPNSRSFIVHLGRAARRAGVDIICSTRAVALSSNAGRVDGIDCDTPKGKRRFSRARRRRAGERRLHQRSRAEGAASWARSEAKVDGVNITATGDGQKLALPLGARILNGDLALGPELRFIPPRQPNLLLKLPPWRALANLMAWSLEHMPSAILRPFVMSFVTTALAPSPALFADGAILVNADGERFTDETDAPAFALPDQPNKVAYILLDARIAAKYSAWPHFISTAPGVAYAYVDDYRRNRPDVFMAGADAAEAGGRSRHAAVVARQIRGAVQRDGRQPAEARRRPLCRARPRPRRVRARRGRPGRRCRASRAWRGRPAHPRPLRGRLDRPGRPAAEGPRPPPGLGLRLRPPRRPQRRLPRHHPRHRRLTGVRPAGSDTIHPTDTTRHPGRRAPACKSRGETIRDHSDNIARQVPDRDASIASGMTGRESRLNRPSAAR